VDGTLSVLCGDGSSGSASTAVDSIAPSVLSNTIFSRLFVKNFLVEDKMHTDVYIHWQRLAFVPI
jgi:hypothetical protein